MCWAWPELEEAPRSVGEEEKEFPGGGGWGERRLGVKWRLGQNGMFVESLWFSVTLLSGPSGVDGTQEAILAFFYSG